MNVAIAHDYLTQAGGAERVVLAFSDAFPDAPIYTSVYVPDGTFPEFRDREVRTSFLQRLPVVRRDHRYGLPLLPRAFDSLEVDADVVLCSSSGWAHGISATGRKIVYCHTPARWLYQTGRFLEAQRGPGKLAMRALRARLRAWDRAAAASADRYLANSTIVQQRIREAYGIEADVLHPPHAADPRAPREPVEGLEPGYFLAVSRLLLYKNVHVLAEAFARLGDQRLVVVGHGPMEREVRHRARGGNVTILGRVTDPQLRWLYANATATVSASYEDFGLVPVEGYAFGKPAVVLRFGGFLDSTVEGATGVFFDQPAPQAVRDAIRRCLRESWDAQAIREHASRFSRDAFVERLQRVVSQVAASGG